MNDHVLFYACHIQHPNFFVLRLKFLEITLDTEAFINLI